MMLTHVNVYRTKELHRANIFISSLTFQGYHVYYFFIIPNIKASLRAAGRERDLCCFFERRTHASRNLSSAVKPSPLLRQISSPPILFIRYFEI